MESAGNCCQPPKRILLVNSIPWHIYLKSFIFVLLVFQGKFSRRPYVLVSSEHTYAHRNHDAATVWAENVEVGKFTICLREMQNFDGLHENIIVVSKKKKTTIHCLS